MVAKAHCIFTPFDSTTGVALTSATVNVYNPGTVTPISATIFDKSNNVLSNPLTSDATTGLVDFYLTVAQTVDIVVSKSGFTTRTYSNVMVLDDAGFDLTAVLTTTGDLPYASANNNPARLPVSATTGAVLNVAAGLPAWSTVIQLSTAANAVGIGAAAATTTGLFVNPANLTSTAQAGVTSNPVFSSAATTTGYCFQASPQTAAASFTLTSMYGLQINSPVLGASSAVTNTAGINIANQGGSGITNAYGIFINPQSGSTLNWSIVTSGDSAIGKASGATGDTTGFLYLNSCAGQPTGNPANDGNGWKAMRYDTTNNKLWVYNGGWHGVVLT